MKSKKAKRKTSSKANGKKAKGSSRPRILMADDLPVGSSMADRRSEALLLVCGKLASRLGIAIDRAHVEDSTFYPVRSPQFAKMFEHYARERDQKRETSPVDASVAVSSVLLSGSPATKLLAQAGKRGAYELMAVGTQARSGVNRLLVGSVAEELIRRSRIPVLTMGPKAAEKAATFLQAEKIRILVPTSLTKNSERAESYAAGLAKRIGGELVLVYSLYDGLHPVVQSVFSLPDSSLELAGLIGDLKKNALQALSKKVAGLKKKGVSATIILDHGYHSAEQAILMEASNSGASLIVMGTHGRSLLAGAFFGRTARGVILGAEIPVITVQSGTA